MHVRTYVCMYVCMYVCTYKCINVCLCVYACVIHYITLHYITLHYITLHYITLHYTTLHYITSHHITSHHITSHCIALHYITYCEGVPDLQPCANADTQNVLQLRESSSYGRPWEPASGQTAGQLSKRNCQDLLCAKAQAKLTLEAKYLHLKISRPRPSPSRPRPRRSCAATKHYERKTAPLHYSPRVHKLEKTVANPEHCACLSCRGARPRSVIEEKQVDCRGPLLLDLPEAERQNCEPKHTSVQQKEN